MTHDFANAAWHMTDSVLVRTLLLIAIACAIRWVWLNWIAPANDAYIDRHVTNALDEEAETWDPMALPLSQSRAAQRIRAQIDANHDAEVARFRDELDNYGGAA